MQHEPTPEKDISSMSVEELAQKLRELGSEIEMLENTKADPGYQYIARASLEDAHSFVMFAATGDPTACVAAVAKYQGMMDAAGQAEMMIKIKVGIREEIGELLQRKHDEED